MSREVSESTDVFVMFCIKREETRYDCKTDEVYLSLVYVNIENHAKTD